MCLLKKKKKEKTSEPKAKKGQENYNTIVCVCIYNKALENL